MAETATWEIVARRAQGAPARPNRRVRGLSVALALLAHLVLIVLLLRHAHPDAPRRGGAGGVRMLRLYPLVGTIHPDARRSPARPVPPQPRPPTPAAPTLDLPRLPLPELPPAKEEAPKAEAQPPEATEAPPMTEREIEEFKRQWAQLQGETAQQALKDAQHHGLRQDLGERQPLLKFGPADADRKSEPARRAPAEENSMFAGELCVTRAGRNGELALALPCLGDGYVTDFGWTARVHAPVRGEPLSGAFDPGGRVMVRNHAFSAETVAAFEDAQVQLRRIQVTLRMVYLPDLASPIQLLSRDDRARALSAQAFPDEHELAAYLREWAANVRRWMDH